MLARDGGVCFGHQESFEGGIPCEANYLTTCLYMDVYTSIVVGWDETPKIQNPQKGDDDIRSVHC